MVTYARGDGGDARRRATVSERLAVVVLSRDERGAKRFFVETRLAKREPFASRTSDGVVRAKGVFGDGDDDGGEFGVASASIVGGVGFGFFFVGG